MALMRAAKDGWMDGVIAAAGADPRVVLLDADISRSVGAGRFADAFPSRYFQLGICEQDMVGHAAGLALAGRVPFVESYAVFAAGRAWEQIRTTVCHMGLGVKIGGAHAGLSAGPDGATHQALEDIELMRVLPGMTVLVPSDAPQAEACALLAARLDGPCYVRFGRNPVPVLHETVPEVVPGGAEVLETGEDVLLIGAGVMAGACAEAGRILAGSGVRASVVNAYSIKPLAGEIICSLARGLRGRRRRLRLPEDGGALRGGGGGPRGKMPPADGFGVRRGPFRSLGGPGRAARVPRSDRREDSVGSQCIAE